MTYATADEVMRRAAAVVLPPPAPMPHDQFCRTLAIPDGPLRGTRYNPAGDPAHAVMAQQITSGIWQRIIAVGAVQTGKSLATILVPVLRHLTILRQPVVYSLPTITKIQEGWAGKLQPSISDSGYQSWLPDKGQGAKGSQTPKFVTFRDPQTNARAGTLYLIPGGGVSESAQAAVTASLVCVDEVDSFPSRHRVELVCKRADSYGPRATRILTSTVKLDGEDGSESGSIILALYEESTASRLWFRCPHCGHWQPLEWDRVRYEDNDEPTAIATARYYCEDCGAGWTDDDRLRALSDWRLVHRGQSVDQATGSVIGAPPPTVAFGLLWTSLDSSLRNLGHIAAEHWRATRAAASGDHGPMRSFVRDQLCRPYRGDLDDERPRHDQMGLAARAHRGHPYGDIPREAEIISTGCDVQKREAWWLTLGMASDLRWWVVDFGYRSTGREHSEPTPADQIAFLDAMRDRSRKIPRAQDVCGVDVGYNTDLVVGWARRHQWLIVRGDARGSGHREQTPGGLSFIDIRRQQDRSLWHFIDGDAVKTELSKSLAREPGTPGAGHLPALIPAKEYLIRHLTSEQWDDKAQSWIKRPSAPNHLLDCLVYAWTLARMRLHRPAQAAPTIPLATDPMLGGILGSLRL